ncbi:MAG: outer membrane protein assembly factor BamA [Verrucomicrobiota bacterium]|nr:MAG: outer membrane protein assembly factor BamA [Verrucomicrobiota bacterium]
MPSKFVCRASLLGLLCCPPSLTTVFGEDLEESTAPIAENTTENSEAIALDTTSSQEVSTSEESESSKIVSEGNTSIVEDGSSVETSEALYHNSVAQDEAETPVNSLGTYGKREQSKNFPVAKIEIRSDGELVRDEAFIRSHIRFTEGEAFDPFAANDAIHSLYAVGMFDDIEITATKNKDLSLNVFVNVKTRPRIANVKFPFEKIGKKKVRKELKTVAGHYLNRANLNEDVLMIYRYYQMNGFPKPQVDARIEPLEDGRVDVCFDITPTDAIRIARVQFHNFGDIDTDLVQKSMALKRWDRNFFSFFTKKGNFADLYLDHDKEVLVNAIRDAGYLDGKLTRAEFVTEGEQRGSLIFDADLGERYYVGDIKLTGATLYDPEVLMECAHLKTGDAFGQAAVRQAAENIQDYYRSRGYVNTIVEAEEHPTFRDNIIDLVLTIHESSLYHLSAITIKGNYKTKDKVLLREFTLEPGDTFNYTAMQIGEMRLHNTGYFKKVDVNAADSDNPHEKGIEINIEEADTGKISGGIAVSARKSQVVFISLEQSNFDLFGPNFQGGGQKLFTKLQLGTRENEAVFSFEEPYLFDKELAFGTEVTGGKTKYRKDDSNFSGSTYDENYFEFEPYFRKRLFDPWIGRLAYNFKLSKITSLGDTAVQPLKDEAAQGRRTASGLKFSIYRDSRDDLLFPRTGSRVEFQTHFYGLGGRTKFTRLEATATQYFWVSEKYDHTLAFTGSVGSIIPFHHRQTPYSERYFLGGQSMMRGFEGRQISPKEESFAFKDGKKETRYGDPVGGNSFCYGAAEYTFALFEPFFGAAFIEAGSANEKKFDNFKNINVDWGVGLRIFIGKMPLRLDWGFPIHAARGTKKDGVQFNFSFGASF